MKSGILILAAAPACACGGNTPEKSCFRRCRNRRRSARHAYGRDLARPSGTYAGTLPAADCPGIETRLTLKKDGTFDLHMKYIDRDAEFDTKGGYSVRGNLLTLTPENGEGVEYYKVEENRLRRSTPTSSP